MLRLELEQHWTWSESQAPWLHLYADARGQPPRVAAVLFADGRSYFCDMEPSQQILQSFERRSDNQIMALEMLSIALGISSFSDILKGRRIVIWSDNTGAQAATSTGRAKSFDHACIAHCIWAELAKLHVQAHVERVPTDSNIADLPSRQEYELLHKIGAKEMEPKLSPVFLRPDAWESLSIRGKL